ALCKSCGFLFICRHNSERSSDFISASAPTMFSLTLLLLSVAVSCVTSEQLNQPPSVTVQGGEGPTIICQVSYSIDSYYTHWIRQPVGKGLEWISRDTTVKDLLKDKFRVILDSSKSRVTLYRKNMQPEDTAVYYCAREPQ
ncbi:hypothetical protein GOODEAATRI_032448, partial [Goodea atripinnis]